MTLATPTTLSEMMTAVWRVSGLSSPGKTSSSSPRPGRRISWRNGLTTWTLTALGRIAQV
jgi:hypothetical protein